MIPKVLKSWERLEYVTPFFKHHTTMVQRNRETNIPNILQQYTGNLEIKSPHIQDFRTGTWGQLWAPAASTPRKTMYSAHQSDSRLFLYFCLLHREQCFQLWNHCQQLFPQQQHQQQNHSSSESDKHSFKTPSAFPLHKLHFLVATVSTNRWLATDRFHRLFTQLKKKSWLKHKSNESLDLCLEYHPRRICVFRTL